MFTEENGKTYMDEFKDGEHVERKLIERKAVENELGTTQVSQTSVESNSSLKEFIEGLKKTQAAGEPTQRSNKQDKSNVKNWTVDNIADWMTFIRMQQYTSLFIENCIDGPALLNIKEKDLLNMGITSKGHRMSIREAIEKLRKLTQPTKQKKIVIHAGHMKKRQACSLSSEVKLRGYYHSVKIIDEEENDGKSSDESENSQRSVKSTSARVNNVRSGSNTFKSNSSQHSSRKERKLSFDKGPMQFPHMHRTQSAINKEGIENLIEQKNSTNKRTKTPKTPRKESNFFQDSNNHEGTVILGNIMANKKGSNEQLAMRENSDSIPEHSMVAKRSRSSSVTELNQVQLFRLEWDQLCRPRADGLCQPGDRRERPDLLGPNDHARAQQRTRL
jgi:hypothetical protein